MCSWRFSGALSRRPQTGRAPDRGQSGNWGREQSTLGACTVLFQHRRGQSAPKARTVRRYSNSLDQNWFSSCVFAVFACGQSGPRPRTVHRCYNFSGQRCFSSSVFVALASGQSGAKPRTVRPFFSGQSALSLQTIRPCAVFSVLGASVEVLARLFIKCPAVLFGHHHRHPAT